MALQISLPGGGVTVTAQCSGGRGASAGGGMGVRPGVIAGYCAVARAEKAVHNWSHARVVALPSSLSGQLRRWYAHALG